MSSELTDSIIDSTVELETQIAIIEDGLVFRRKTINQWIDEISLPYLDSKMSVTEIQEFNYKFIAINEVIMSNLSYAKSYNEISKAQYEIALTKSIERITIAIKADATKRMPGIDILNKQASMSCIKEYTALKITEVFLEFWRVHYDRLKLIDSRLSNINYLSGRHNV